MNTGTIQIMWKEIAIILVALYAFRNVLDIYMIHTYKKIIDMYGKADTEQLKKKAKKHLKHCTRSAVGPWNKQTYYTYNGLCLFLASIALMEENEKLFFDYMNAIKKENEFEMKPFVLSLYYRSKGQMDLAMKYYKKYLTCKHQDNGISIILNGVFEGKKDEKMFYQAIHSFKNPAIIKLFTENEIF